VVRVCVQQCKATVRSAELRRFKEQADVSRVRLRQALSGLLATSRHRVSIRKKPAGGTAVTGE
jgi:hypothetical protein